MVELLVSLVLGALILASATGSLLQQHRATVGMVRDAAAASQSRSGAALLASELALLSPEGADLVRGQSLDTALQLRTAITTGIACDSAPTLTLAGASDDLAGGGIASAPRTGDSLWWYSSDSARWIDARVLDSWADSLHCAAADGASPVVRRVVRIRANGGELVPGLSPIRVTRQVRIALYRSGDGTWQLGLREWNDATGSFAAPQPVAGPFQRSASDGSRTGFRYFDAGGTPLHPEADSLSAALVSRIRLTTVALTPERGGVRSALPVRDSTDVVVRPRAAH